LRETLSRQHPDLSRFFVGAVHCTSEILAAAAHKPVKTIGYMGFDHEHDFKLAIPALVNVLTRYPNINFHLFGKIPMPKELAMLGARVRTFPVVPDYQDFLRKMLQLDWQIGICPLADTDFNTSKSDNKWVEYSAVGTAVIASRGSIYDACCSDGCGLLAEGTAQWEEAFTTLIENPAARLELVNRAQKKLSDQYAPKDLIKQIFQVISLARENTFHPLE
jgi:glycosyltransferase involved in cell wall biosynthesis